MIFPSKFSLLLIKVILILNLYVKSLNRSKEWLRTYTSGYVHLSTVKYSYSQHDYNNCTCKMNSVSFS